MASRQEDEEIVQHLKSLTLNALCGAVASEDELFAFLAADDKIDVLVHALKRAQKSGAEATSRVAQKEIANLQEQVRVLESYAGGFLAFFSDRYKLITALGVCAIIAAFSYSVGSNRGFYQGLHALDDMEVARAKFEKAFAAISFHYIGTLDGSPAPCLYEARIQHPGVERACVVVLQSKAR